MIAAIRAAASLGVDVGAAAVGVVEPAVIGDAEDGQALGDLGLADLGELVRRPTVRVGGLATRRGDAHDARDRCVPRRP